MFRYPWEQTGKYIDCTDAMVVLQDRLTGALIGLARATDGNDHAISDSTAAAVVEGLCATLPDAKFDHDALLAMIQRVDGEKRKLVPGCYECTSPCGRNNDYDMQKLWEAEENIRSLKCRILFGIRGVAVYAHQAAALGHQEESIHKFLYKALFAIGMDDWGQDLLLPILQEVDAVKRKCTALLDKANAANCGHSPSTEVG